MRRCLECGLFSVIHINGGRGRNDGSSDPCVIWDWIQKASRAALSHTHMRACTHTCSSICTPSTSHISYLSSQVPQPRCWMSRRQERPPARLPLFLFLSSTYQVSCPLLGQFGLQPWGWGSSPGPYPLFPANCLSSIRSQLKGNFCREASSPAHPKSCPNSYPTFLMPSPSAACSQASVYTCNYLVSPSTPFHCNSSRGWHVTGAHYILLNECMNIGKLALELTTWLEDLM